MTKGQNRKLKPLIRRNITLLAINAALSVTAFQGIFVLAPLSLLHLTGSEFISGTFMTFFAGGTIITLVPAGVLMDRFGRRVGLISGPLILMLGTLLSSLLVFANGGISLLAAITICGMGVGFTSLNNMSGGDLAPPRRKAELMAILSVCSSLGLFLGPLLGGLAVDLSARMGWNSIATGWWGPSSLAAVALLIGLMIWPDPKKIAENPEKYHGEVDELSSSSESDSSSNAKKTPDNIITGLLRLRPMQVCLFTSSAFTVLRTSMLVLLATVLIKRGFSATLAGSMISAMGFGAFLTAFPAGLLADRKGRKLVIQLACLISFVGLPLVFLAGSPLMIGIGLVFLGMGFSVILSMSRTILVDITDSQTRGKAFGLYQTVNNITRVVTPSIAALLNTVFGWFGIGTLCLVMVILSLSFVMFLREAQVGQYKGTAKEAA